MKGFLRTILLVLSAVAAVLGIAMLRGDLRPAEAEPSRAELQIRLDADGVRRCYQDGRLCERQSGLVRDRDSGCWWYVENGAVDAGYTGFAEDGDGWWYVEKGAVIFDENEVLEGRVDGEEGLWYVSGGLVERGYTGVTDYTDSGLWWYVENGKADPSFTGFARSSRGWWYVENGRVDRSRTALVEGVIGEEEALWYVSGGKAQLSFSGLAELGAGGDAYYILYGRAAPAFTGIVRLEGDCWYCREGKVARDGLHALRCDGADWIVSDGRAEKAETEEQKTFFRALELVDRITTADMTQEEKLRVCFDYAKDSFRECSPRFPHLTEDGWQIIYANDMFTGDGGNCFSFAAAFAYMAKALGYEEVYACNSGNHGWTEIDGKIYDPEWSLHNGGTDIYALDYDSDVGKGYQHGLWGADRPGREWVRVKI